MDHKTMVTTVLCTVAVIGLMVGGYAYLSKPSPTIATPVPEVTKRGEHVPVADDLSTTNDESNDQPTGYFGDKTLQVHSLSAGNTYTLDVEIDDNEVDRIYFPKGGHVSFTDCELDDDFEASCTDTQGRQWDFEGEF